MKETILTIRIATDFSRFPAGRYLSDGPYSGEGFMREKLIPALQNGGKVQIILDGTMGYGSSFLEEDFGYVVQYALSYFFWNFFFNQFVFVAIYRH